MSNVLVVAPHPDDEVLGVGGTILRHLADGDAVHVVLCTRGDAAAFGEAQVETVQREAREVHAFLGLTGSHFLDLPAASLDTVPGADVNAALDQVFRQVGPDVVYLPHVGDVHRDHQILFQAAMVAARPTGGKFPGQILAYETVSETNWYAAPATAPFVPNVFIDITPHLERKLEAFSMYASQLRQPPHERSVEALQALATLRGHTVHLPAAEAFMLVREVRPGQGW